jgi:hypothetical protein
LIIAHKRISVYLFTILGIPKKNPCRQCHQPSGKKRRDKWGFVNVVFASTKKDNNKKEKETPKKE